MSLNVTGFNGTPTIEPFLWWAYLCPSTHPPANFRKTGREQGSDKPFRLVLSLQMASQQVTIWISTGGIFWLILNNLIMVVKCFHSLLNIYSRLHYHNLMLGKCTYNSSKK